MVLAAAVETTEIAESALAATDTVLAEVTPERKAKEPPATAVFEASAVADTTIETSLTIAVPAVQPAAAQVRGVAMIVYT